jgi:hypothetical protein
MITGYVYVLSHIHEFSDGEEDTKLIGIYSSPKAAEEARQRAVPLPVSQALRTDSQSPATRSTRITGRRVTSPSRMNHKRITGVPPPHSDTSFLKWIVERNANT